MRRGGGRTPDPLSGSAYGYSLYVYYKRHGLLYSICYFYVQRKLQQPDGGSSEEFPRDLEVR